jgi:hypothetical protein
MMDSKARAHEGALTLRKSAERLPPTLADYLNGADFGHLHPRRTASENYAHSVSSRISVFRITRKAESTRV